MRFCACDVYRKSPLAGSNSGGSRSCGCTCLSRSEIDALGRETAQRQRRAPRLAPRLMSTYGAAALMRACAEMAATRAGRNAALNRAAFSLGTVVSADEIARGDVERAGQPVGRSLGHQIGIGRRRETAEALV